MELFDRIEALHERNAELIDELQKSGVQLAENTANYRIALAEETLRLRSEGERATLIPDLARGDRHVAELRQLKDCAEAIYKTTQEAINVNKLRIRTLSEQLNREWAAAGGGY